MGTVRKCQSSSVDRMIKIGFHIYFIVITVILCTIIIIIVKKKGIWIPRKTELTFGNDPLQVGIYNLVL